MVRVRWWWTLGVGRAVEGEACWCMSAQRFPTASSTPFRGDPSAGPSEGDGARRSAAGVRIDGRGDGSSQPSSIEGNTAPRGFPPLGHTRVRSLEEEEGVAGLLAFSSGEEGSANMTFRLEPLRSSFSAKPEPAREEEARIPNWGSGSGGGGGEGREVRGRPPDWRAAGAWEKLDAGSRSAGRGSWVGGRWVGIGSAGMPCC